MDVQSALQALKPMMSQLRAFKKLEEVLDQAVLADQLKGELERRNRELTAEKESLEKTVAEGYGKIEDLKQSYRADLAATKAAAQKGMQAELAGHKEELAGLQSQIAKAKRDYQSTAESHRKRLGELAAEIQEKEGKLAQAKADYEAIAVKFK